MIPSPEKTNGGEDAWFANNNVLIVADGVGGWSRHGVDSGKYSRALCAHVSDFSDESQQTNDFIAR